MYGAYYTFTYNNGFEMTVKEVSRDVSFVVVVAEEPAVDEEIITPDNATEAVVENTVAKSPIEENVVMSVTPCDEAVSKIQSVSVATVPAETCDAEPEIAPTAAEIILSYVRSYMQLTALPVTKNSLFLI